MRGAHEIGLAPLLEAPERVLAHDRQKREHGAATDLGLLHQRAVDERRDPVDRAPVPRPPGPDGFDRLEREPLGEHAEVLEQIAVLRRQQADAPIERRAHRAVPVGEIPHGGGEQRQAALEPLRDAGRREHPQLRGREFDGQGKPFEAAADVHDRAGVLFRELERGLGRLGPVDEQGHCGGLLSALQRSGGAVRRRRQRRHVVDLLAPDSQHDAAGHQEARSRCDRVQPDEHRCDVDDLLEVVEHEQHVAAGEGVRDALLERRFAVVADAEGVGDRGEQQRGFEHVLQADEVGAVGEHVACRDRDLDREAALADPARADQADHPVVAAREQLEARRRSRARGRSWSCTGPAPARRVRKRHPRRASRRTSATRRSARPAGWRGRPRPAFSSSSAVSNGRYAAVSSAWIRAMSSLRRSSRLVLVLM